MTLLHGNDLSSGEQFQYDFAGRRVKKTEGRVTTYYFNEYYEVEETAPEPTGPFSYLLWTKTDGAAAPEALPPQPVAPAEDGPTSIATRSYYVNGLRVAQHRDGVWTWIHSDHLHSATVMTDVNGNEVRRLAYTAFGEEAVNSGSGDKPPYTYTGKELDGTGLMYYGARYYDPVLCRFLTPDTVYDVGTQGLNRYSYALNNPIIYRDPTGNYVDADLDPNYVRQTMAAEHPYDDGGPTAPGNITGSAQQIEDGTATMHNYFGTYSLNYWKGLAGGPEPNASVAGMALNSVSAGLLASPGGMAYIALMNLTSPYQQTAAKYYHNTGHPVLE